MFCVQPGIDYFQLPTASDIDSLSVIPFLNDSGVIITGLKEELPAYLARANGVKFLDILSVVE